MPSGVPRLSPRLQAVAQAVVPRQPMADVGTDHGRLPAALVEQRRVPWALGIDVARGPLLAAHENLRAWGLTDRVTLRSGSGLQPLAPGEVATATMAGMGGAKIASLVADGRETAFALRRLVVQPNTDWPRVRRDLDRLGLDLVEEDLLCEGGAFYVVMVFEPARPEGGASLDDTDCELGPLLRRQRPPVFAAWIARRLTDNGRALERMGARVSAEHPRRRALLIERERLLGLTPW